MAVATTLVSIHMHGVCAAPEPAGAAQRLSALHTSLAARLAASPLQQPLLVDSSEGQRRARGDVHALLPHAWPTLAAALQQPAHWCEALLLHLYVKRCSPGPATLTLYVATSHDAPAESAKAMPLAFAVDNAQSGYLKVSLTAENGPMGMREVEFLFEAVPAGPAASFVHFSYQAGASALGDWAMQAYLATRGRNKVGFSAAPDDSRPGTIRGTRGVVERNAMRYHLAVATYLDSLAVPEAARLEHRLGAWFDATERYPRQLHETDRATYIATKRREQAAAPRPSAP
jgi:hypothetical protein